MKSDIKKIDRFWPLLDEYLRRGGVLDFEFFELATESVETAHFESASTFLSTWYQDNLALEKRHPEKSFRNWWNPEKLIGTKISPEDFWGDLCSARGNEVSGFKSAFLFPPYKLTHSDEENLLLFESIANSIFGDSGGNSIWSWSTDCSSYFEPGLEWWGAWLWTVHRSGSFEVTVIGASASD